VVPPAFLFLCDFWFSLKGMFRFLRVLVFVYFGMLGMFGFGDLRDFRIFDGGNIP